MKDYLINLLSLQPQNIIPEVTILTAILWAVILLCVVFSVVSQQIGVGAKIGWILAAITLPPVGVLCYCGYCALNLELSYFPAWSLWQQQRKTERALKSRARANRRAAKTVAAPSGLSEAAGAPLAS